MTTSLATRTGVLTGAALIGFAANSLLCRRALGMGLIDAASFTTVRLASGAAALTLIHFALRGARPRGGSWLSAAMLFAYAASFSAAYLSIGAGIGALLLFGAVQTTMLAWAVARGERPRPRQWVGIALALAGLAWLALPGSHLPDRAGAALMLGAGAAWGIYSLKGRGARDPLAITAHNFARTMPFTLALSLSTFRAAHASPAGIGLAIASGAIASGVGYSLWYAALPFLSATRAAAVQLAVPIVAAGGAVLILGEQITPRLLASGAAILVGVWLAIRRG